MVAPANLAWAHSSPQPRRLRRKTAFSSLSTSSICPPDPIPSVIEALNAPVNTIRQSNRETVIINSMLYPPGFLSNSETGSTVASTGKPNFKVGGGKLRKKSLLHLSKEALKVGRGIPLPLPSDYLNVEEASREATLLRVSTLSASRTPARHMQNGKISTTIQKRGPAARSADICDALSSHPVMVPEAVTSMPGPDISGTISTAVEQADPPQQERRTRPQKRVRFKSNLESTREKRERLDTGHISTAIAHADPSPRERVERTQKRGVRFAENLESTGEKRERLERERDEALDKCDALERILDSVYQDRDSLKLELGCTSGRREYLEKKIIDLRKRIRNLETDVIAQHVKLDNEIDRGRLREAENLQLRDENQRLQAEIVEQSHGRLRKEVDQRSGGRTTTGITQSLQADCHLRCFPKGSPADSVLVDDVLQEEDLGRTLYDITDAFGATHSGFQNKVETSHHRFHDPQIASRPAAESFIECSSSNVPPISVFPQADLNNLETVLARHHLVSQEPGATTPNETLQQQIKLIDIGPVTDQLPGFLPTSSLSSLPRDNDAIFFKLSISNQPTEKGAELGSPRPISQQPSQQLPELDPNIGCEDNDTESDQPNTDILFRFGSPRIQTVPAVHRMRISTDESEQSDSEVYLMSNLNTWEWSSIPDLRLWDPESQS